MLAFDRDGTLIGSLTDFRANDPRDLTEPNSQRIIQPVANWINKNGGIIISNQQGITNGYTTLDRVVAQFVYLHNQIPGIRGSLFCPNKGESCWLVIGSESTEISLIYSHLKGSFRKPSPGMFAVAASLFGPLEGYVGDLSGLSDYAEGRDTDLKAAIASGIGYWDVREFIAQHCH